MNNPYPATFFLIFLTIFIVTACTTPDPGKVVQSKDGEPNTIPKDIAAIPDAVPRYEPRTRAGNPPSYEVFGIRYQVLPDSKDYKKRGIASWYGTKFHGKKTSNGESYDMFAMTAAHKTLPIPSYARVTNLQNQRSVVIRINDRGPFHDNRIIDLSYTAAVKLGIQQAGTGFVEVQTIEPEQSLSETEPDSGSAVQTVFLQLGAFNNEENARQLKKTVEHMNLSPVHIQTVMRQGKPLFKVQAGPLTSADETDMLIVQLEKIGITEVRPTFVNNTEISSMLQ